MRIRKHGLPPLPCVPSTFPPKPRPSTSHHRNPPPLQTSQPRSHLPTDDDSRCFFFVPTAHGAAIEQRHSNISSSSQEDHCEDIDFQRLENSASRLGPGLHSAHDATKQVDVDVGRGDVHVIASRSIVAAVMDQRERRQDHLEIMNSGTNSNRPSGPGSGPILSRQTHDAIGSSDSSFLASFGRSAGLLPLLEQEKSSSWSTHQHAQHTDWMDAIVQQTERQQSDVMIETYRKTFRDDVNGQEPTHSNAIDYHPDVSAAAADLSYHYIPDLERIESESRIIEEAGVAIRCGRTSGRGWQCKNMRSTSRKTIYCDYHYDKVSIARLHASGGRKRNRKKTREEEEEEEMEKQRIVNVDMTRNEIDEMVEVDVVRMTDEMAIGKDCTNKVSLLSTEMGEQQVIGHEKQGWTTSMTLLGRVLQVARLAAEHRKLVMREVENMAPIITAAEDETCLAIAPLDLDHHHYHVQQQLPFHESIPNLLDEAAPSFPANYTKPRARRRPYNYGTGGVEQQQQQQGFIELEGTQHGQLHVYKGAAAAEEAEDYRTDDVDERQVVGKDDGRKRRSYGRGNWKMLRCDEDSTPTMVVDSNNNNNLRDVALKQLQSIDIGSWAGALATADQVAASCHYQEEEEEGEMRCSRMDGRGWRCKRRRSAVGTSNFCEHHRRTTAKRRPAGNNHNKKRRKKKKAGTNEKAKQRWPPPPPPKKRKKQEEELPRTRLLQDLQES